MCAYRVRAGESRGPGWIAAAILAATLLGLIVVGFAGPGRASDEVLDPITLGSCPSSVWEGSSFQVQVRSTGGWNRIGFHLVFESDTAGTSDYLSKSGFYTTTNPGTLRFQTIPDDLAEGEETFAINVGSDRFQVGAIPGQRCEIAIMDDDLMAVERLNGVPHVW